MTQEILLAYGSQSGKSLQLCSLLKSALYRFDCSVSVSEINSLSSKDLTKQELIIFVCSTTGQGELPDNAKDFWKILLRRCLPKIFTNVMFTVFGLGDSSYVDFNWAAKKIEKRVLQLGGASILPRGEGDEQGDQNVFVQFNYWLNDLVTVLKMFYPERSGGKLENEVLGEPQNFDLKAGNVNKYFLEAGEVSRAGVRSVERITSFNHWQDIRLLVLDAKIHHQPGDVVTLFPNNSKEDVDKVLKSFKWEQYAESVVVGENLCIFSSSAHRVVPTIRNILIYLLDLTSPPRPNFFQILSRFCSKPEDHIKRRLSELSRPEFITDYYDYVISPHRSPIDVIHDFPGITVPIGYIFELFQPIVGRRYSIANSETTNSGQLELCIAIVGKHSEKKVIREGLCSKWVKTLEQGQSISISVNNEGNFSKALKARHMLMVATGTGIAPIRAFLQERIHDGNYDNILFFGCRHEDRDFLFEDELREYERLDQLKLFVAFSRETTKGTKYVQHLIRLYAGIVYEFVVVRKSAILICGRSGKMPQEVRESLAYVLSQQSNLKQDEAKQKIKNLSREGFLFQETW